MHKMAFVAIVVCLYFAMPRLGFAATVASTSQPVRIDASQAGIAGDGTTLNTAAIQKAINACSAKGGGVITFPAGRYLTGTIQLKDNVLLHLDEKAIILGSPNAADYRSIDPFKAGDGIPLGYALIIAVDAKHVGIDGPGEIDGQGKAVAAAQRPYVVRPFLTRWVGCEDVLLAGVTERDPGAWTNHFSRCRRVSVSGITVRSAASKLRNNDGIDIDSSEGVRIADCDIESGDDAICMKTTSDQACRDVTVSGCKLMTRCNAVKLGTESLGDFERIAVSHCQIRDTGMAGIALYTVDGSHLHDVTLSDLTMDGVTIPISIRLGARLKTFREGDHAKPPGTLSDVTIRNLKATRVGKIGLLINGIPDHPVESLTLENVHIDVPGGGKAQDAEVQFAEKEATYPEWNMFGKVFPAYGVYLRHVRGVKTKDVRITPTNADPRPAAALIDVAGVAAGDFAR